MKYFYLLLLSIIPAAVFSQTNYQKGYIIKTTDDTVRGYINYQEWNHNPKFINFKTDLKAREMATYSPENINGFSVDGYDLYRVCNCTISTGATQGTDLSIGIDTATIHERIFLKAIVNDTPVKLYEYVDNIKPRYFIQDNEESPVELGYSVFYSDAENSRVESNERYKRQLAILAQKYAPANTIVQNKITTLEYNEKALVSVVNRINNKISHQDNAVKQSNFRFFAGGGVNITQTKFKGDNLLASSKAGQSTTPEISIGMDFFSNAHIQRLILRGELLYSWITPTLQTSGMTSTGPQSTTVAINQHTITFLPQIIYNFYNTEKLKIYGGVGLGINYSRYNNSYSQTIYGVTPGDKLPYDLEAYWIKVPVEAGVVLNKRFDVFARYSFPTSFSNYVGYSITNTEYQFGIHYLFGKKY